MKKALFVFIVCLAGCEAKKAAGPDPARLGGAATVFDVSENAFGFPIPGLAPSRRDLFFVGNSIFRNNWVVAPASTEGHDGLGPLYNAVSCSSCHLRDGRGAPPAGPDDEFLGLLLRVSAPGGGPHAAWGDQIQPYAVPGVPREPRPRVTYIEAPGTYKDGTLYSLRRPVFMLEAPAELLMSPRLAPAIIGMGLIEAIPEPAILARADEADVDRDGISGRPNRVLEVRRSATVLGRFGWKANQPTVEQQVAGAFLGDIGITSPIFQSENAISAEAVRQPSGGSPEIDEAKLRAVTLYVKALAVPARRRPADPLVRRGEDLFIKGRCAACHTPRYQSGQDADLPELAGQVIFPYTDLLLHDMGPDLADGRPDGLASGSEWRTPPLWGLGLAETVNGSAFFLHDGRARGPAEAILWHGGEAEGAREYFRALPASDREALIAFLRDL